jgi:hypothetical protein
MQYIILFESVQSINSSSSSSSAVNFKITTTPENAGTQGMRSITTASGLRPQGASFVTWSSLGGANGTIIVSDSTTNALFVNQALGEGLWKVVSTTAARAYGREVHAGMSLSSKSIERILNSLSSRQESAPSHRRFRRYWGVCGCHGHVYEL